MALFQGIKRITTEDFETKDQSLVSKLAFPINAALQFIATSTNKGISFDDNINCDKRTIEFSVDGTGTPKATLNYKSALKTLTKGIIVVRVENLTNSSIFPTGAPFITWDENNFQVTITNITGLVTDNKYRLTIISIP